MEESKVKRKRLVSHHEDSEDNSSSNDDMQTSSISLRGIPRAAREAANSRLAVLADMEDGESEFNERIDNKKSSQDAEIKPSSGKLPVKKNALMSSSTQSKTISERVPLVKDANIKKKKSVLGSQQQSHVRESEISTLKRMSSRLGDAEWMEADKGEERLAAVSRAIDRIFEMSLKAENFRLFGNDMIQCFYDVGTVTGDPIRKKTLKYLEFLANRWKYSIMQEGWISNDNDEPTPPDVIDCLIGVYCMERVGIRHDVKNELFEFLSNECSFTCMDYFGWNPKSESPPEVGREYVEADENDHTSLEWGLRSVPISKYRNYSNSLIHSFFADRVSIHLDCSYYDIYKWLPVFHPYKGAHELPWNEFIDQCFLVTHVIFTNNNWGELQLSPSLYAHEYYFIRYTFMLFIRNKDMHLLPEFIECLRAFGCDDKDELIKLGLRTILSMQNSNGLWDETELEPYRTYHATMCCSQALLAHRYRGYGPGIPEIAPLLIKWSDEEKGKVDELELLTSRCRTFKKEKIHASFLKDLREVGTDGDDDDVTTTDERVQKLKMAIRGVVKAQAKEDAVPMAATVQDTNEAKEVDAMDIEPETPLSVSVEDSEVKAQLLNSLDSLVAGLTWLVSVDWTVAENMASDEVASDRMAELRRDLELAREWPVTADLLKASPDAVRLLKVVGKLQLSQTQGIASSMEGLAAEVIGSWKQTVASGVVAVAVVPQ